MRKYIDVTPEAGKDFYLKFQNQGKLVMLNLLKFRTKANYSGFEHLKPEVEISGAEAYQLYVEHTLPELKNAGSRIIYYGKSENFLIGPEWEKWDALLLVEHESIEKFMGFAQNKEYQKNVGHRTAALEDSRLLPSQELEDYT